MISLFTLPRRTLIFRPIGSKLPNDENERRRDGRAYRGQSARAKRWFLWILAAGLALGGRPAGADEGKWEVLFPPSTPGLVSNAAMMAMDGSGNLYVGDPDYHRILMRSPQGEWSVVADLVLSDDPSIFQTPFALAADGPGNLYVSDGQSLRVRSPQGVWSVPRPMENVTSIVPDRSGRLYVASPAGVEVRSPDGNWSLLTRPLPGYDPFPPFGTPGEVVGEPDQILPRLLAMDGSGNLFVAGAGSRHWVNHEGDVLVPRLVMRTPEGQWSTLADGRNDPSVSPVALVVDGSDNLYVAHHALPVYSPGLPQPTRPESGRVTKRTPQGQWSVLADTGSAPDQVKSPLALAVDGSGNLYVADGVRFAFWTFANRRVTVRTPQGEWKVLAPTGGAPDQVKNPASLLVDGAGHLYVGEGTYSDFSSDTTNSNHRIARRSPGGDWSILTPALPDTLPGPNFNPTHLAADRGGNLFVSDQVQGLWLHTPQGTWSRVADPELNSPATGVTTDAGNNLYIWGSNRMAGGQLSYIKRRSPEGVWSFLATDGFGPDQVSKPDALTLDAFGNLFVADSSVRRYNSDPLYHRIQMRTPQGVWSIIDARDGDNELGKTPHALATDLSGNLYVGDLGMRQVRMRTPQGIWSTIATTGDAPDQVTNPIALAVDRRGALFVAEGHRLLGYYGEDQDPSHFGHRRILMRSPEGEWSVLLTHDSQPDLVNNPHMLAVDALGNLYVADHGNSNVVMRTPEGAWSVIAPPGAGADPVYDPVDMTVDASGDLYIADARNRRVLRYTPAHPFLYGDLDFDGEVTVADAVRGLQLIIGLAPMTPDGAKRGDVTPMNPDGTVGDGALTVNDVVRLLRRVAGLDPDPWP